MKSFLKILALAVILNISACIAPREASAQASVSFQLFYDELSPYGSWVDYQNYGYVWVPDVDQDFSPYSTDGHWVFTDDGWTWVSDYSWGWAPFHYGRWAYDDSYGWLWVPHNEWGPAWVTWRRSEGYYGWAPMGPGISVELSFGGGYRVPNERWTFVSDRDINRPDIDRHYVDRSTNVTIINNSTVINNTYVDNSRHTKYVAGPARDDVQKVTGTAIRPVVIRENDKPGQHLSNDQLQIYRPQVQTANNNDRKPAPSKLVTLKEVKPVSERRHDNQQRDQNPPANGKEQPTQAPINAPPSYKAPVVQPHVVNPPDKNKVNEQSPQPQDNRPSDNQGRRQQSPVVNPPDKNKINEPPPNAQPPAVKPPGDMRRGQQPPFVNPPDKNKINEQAPQPQDNRPSDYQGRKQQPPVVNPPDDKGKRQQPPVVTPPDMNKRNEVAPQNARPSDKMGRGQQPPVVTPPDMNKNIKPQSKPRTGRPLNVKKQPPQTPPPNNKGKGPDSQPSKSDKQNRDSTKTPSQFQLR